MSLLNSYTNITVKNNNNLYLVNEFIRYYEWIYSNYTKSTKSSKENYYKLIVIKKIIDIIAKYSKPILSGSQLESIKGIGPKTIKRIDEIINTGKLSEINDVKHQINAVKELSEIYGIGPVKASEFYEKYGITTIKQLIEADEQGKINLTNQMKLGIKYVDTLCEKIPRILIARLDIFVHDELMKIDTNFISVMCGSYRRHKDFSSDIDILITNKLLKSKDDTGIYLKQVLNVLSKYIIVDSLTTSFNTHFQGFATFKLIHGIPINYDKSIFDIQTNVTRLDIIVVPIQYFYYALLHFTGSREFNQKLRLHAKSLGYKLSEYGLEYINKKNKKINIPITSEQDIFNVLLLKYVPPEKR